MLRNMHLATAVLAAACAIGAAAAQNKTSDSDADTCAQFATMAPDQVIAACGRLLADPEVAAFMPKGIIANMHFNRGYAYTRQGNHQKALIDLGLALRFNPSLYLAYFVRGKARADMGDDRAAILDYTQCTRLKPRDELCHFNRATSHSRLRNYTQAIRDYTAALQINPKSSDAHAGRGFAREMLGHRAAAIADYRSAINRGSTDPRVTQRLAGLDSGTAPRTADAADDRQTCAYPPNTQDGIAACTRRIKAGGGADDEERSETFNNRAWLYHRQGHQRHALLDVERALALNPDYAAAYDTRGHIYRVMGHRDDAIQDFRKALSLNPTASTRKSSEQGLATLGVTVSPFMTWRIRNRHQYAVELRFFSKTRNAAWPGGTKVWVLRDEEVHSYTLNCQPGEKICFGAWVRGARSRYWGVGRDGDNGCADCCYDCNNQVTPVRNLGN